MGNASSTFATALAPVERGAARGAGGGGRKGWKDGRAKGGGQAAELESIRVPGGNEAADRPTDRPAVLPDAEDYFN
jgi:hypothetical protein